MSILIFLLLLCSSIFCLNQQSDMNNIEYAKYHNNRQNQFEELSDATLYDFKITNEYTLISFYEEY